MKSAKVKKSLSISRLSFRVALDYVRQIDAIGNHANRIAQSITADRSCFGLRECTHTSGFPQMLVFIEKCSDPFFPYCVSHGPWFQHAVRMNHVRATRLPMPAVRTDRAIFPQTMHRQNVDVGVQHRWDELV